MNLQLIIIRAKKKGMTQRQIAAVVGCSQPLVSKIENGAAGEKNPSHKLVKGFKKLGAQLGMKVED